MDKMLDEISDWVEGDINDKIRIEAENNLRSKYPDEEIPREELENEIERLRKKTIDDMKFKREYENERHLGRLDEGMRDLDYAEQRLAKDEMIDRNIAENDLLWEMHNANVNEIAGSWATSAKVKAMDMQQGSVKESTSSKSTEHVSSKAKESGDDGSKDVSRESDGFAAVIDSYMEGANKDITARMEGIDKKISNIDHLKQTQATNETYDRGVENLQKRREQIANTMLDSAIEATKEQTNASTINKSCSIIKENIKSREQKTQEEERV